MPETTSSEPQQSSPSIIVDGSNQVEQLLSDYTGDQVAVLPQPSQVILKIEELAGSIDEEGRELPALTSESKLSGRTTSKTYKNERNEYVGFSHTVFNEHTMQAYFQGIELSAGEGYGRSAYLEAIRYSLQKGYDFRSDTGTTSAEAVKMWKWLEEQGIAVSVDEFEQQKDMAGQAMEDTYDGYYVVNGNNQPKIAKQGVIHTSDQSDKTNDQFPEKKFQDAYEKQRGLLEAQRQRQKQREAEHIQKLQDLPVDAAPRVRGVYEGNLAMVRRGMRLTEGDLEFMRPSSADDVAYRLRVYETLPKAIREAVPKGTPIRFHGSPFPRARDIIKSGQISSSVDREGIETSYDVGGQISVTMPEDISTTVHDFTGILAMECTVPAGCIFVLSPASEADAQSGSSQLMGSVYFDEQPERLLGIMTSPENIPTVQEWAEGAGIDTSKVHEFFAYADTLRTVYPPVPEAIT